MTHFPIFADLRDQSCLVVGGGAVAARKVDRLLEASASVTVNAPEICAELEARAASGQVRHVRGEFDPALVDASLLIIAATSDPDANRRVAAAAARSRRLCNVVDDGELSTCIVPAVVDRSPVIVAIGTGGRSPVLARRLRQQIEAWLPSRIGELAEWAGAWRGAVRGRIRTHAGRLRFWEWTFDGAPGRAVLAGERDEADERLRNLLEADANAAPIDGVAWFVGAGPGDPGLITRRGLQLLQSADVIMHDRLVSPEILEFARRESRLIPVGKRAGGPAAAQVAINEQLVELVAAGHRVCRLKGGDPFVFGRGAEEIAAVAAAGQPYEIVPGITAANGCAAAAGIPLTARHLASAVTLVTAQRTEDDDQDWEFLARGSHTLVVYMGVRRLPDTCQRLVLHGRRPTTPAALIERGTTPHQRVVGGTLEDIDRRAADAGIESPALLIVGEVVGLADKLRWLNETEARARLAAHASH